jgi:exodeoxyribonuclease V alpha subunit
MKRSSELDKTSTPSPKYATLTGVLERVVFLNEENGFTVARLQVAGRRDLVAIVGVLPSPLPGETLRLTGDWIVDNKFGEQFRVSSCLSVLPATLTGIERYLGSGLVKGIGPIMAKRLVAMFALETLDVIEKDADRLREVEGIGPIRSERISRAWEEQKEIREVMIFLQGQGISSTYAVKIYKAYGDKSISIVKENPYRLALDISGIGFKTADKIARNMGIDPASPMRAEAGVINVLSGLVDEGHVYFPCEELEEKAAELLEIDKTIVETALETLKEQRRVVIEDHLEEKAVYLTPLYMAEVNTASRLKALLGSPKQLLNIDAEKAIDWVQKGNQIQLADMQKEALRKAITGKILVITGGPGTGKTTLVNSLIKIMARVGQRIILASPTGRAAKRLAEVTGHEAKTIHRMLEYSPKEGGFKRNEENPLDADLVVIDEVSMVDILLMNHLLKAIPPGATLVMVGDSDQLPSVGPGNVLQDIISSGSVETIRLTDIFRQAKESLIVVNAHRINEGKFPQSDAQPGQIKDFYFVNRDDPQKTLDVIKELCKNRLPQALHLDPLEDIQVMSPMHRGIVGVANLNSELQNLFNPDGKTVAGGGRLFRVNDKVMQIKNNYEKETFNGDIGKLIGVDLEEQKAMVKFEDRIVDYDWSELDELVLAYAVSIHKSQGSEYPAVVIPLLTQHYIMLQRNLLYTAITRAKQMVIIVGSKRAMAIAIKNAKVQHRYTGLSDRLMVQKERSLPHSH